MLFRTFMIRTEREGDTYTVAPSGELDMATAPLLEVEIRRGESADVLRIVFDLGKVEFISVAAVRLCAIAHRRSQRLVLVHPTRHVAGAFRLAPHNVAWPQTPVHADRVAR